jgi:hypothetical protein
MPPAFEAFRKGHSASLIQHLAAPGIGLIVRLHKTLADGVAAFRCYSLLVVTMRRYSESARAALNDKLSF